MSNLAFLGRQIPTTWIEATIGDVTSKVGSGATPRGGASVYVDHGVALIRSQNVHDHEFRPSGLAYISDDAAHALRGVTVAADDVMLNITGDSILRTCIAPSNVGPARVNQHVAIIRSNGRVDPVFLQKWLSLPAMKDYMLGHSSGGTRKAITKGHILDFPIPLPPIEEQRSIASTLGALDDKIDSNRRAISLIGELVAARFAGITEQGRASLQPLGELTEVVRGRSYTSAELSESDVALVTLKSINRNGGYKSNGLKPYTGIYKPEQIVAPGEIVVAQTDLTQGAEVVGRGVRVPSSNIAKVLVASLDLVIVRPLDDMPIEYLFGLLTTEAFREHCRSRVTGTTVLHLAKDAIPSWPAPVVNRAEQLKFSNWARDLFSRMDALSSENDRLLATRDALIPGLLSGAIRVSEAEIAS